MNVPVYVFFKTATGRWQHNTSGSSLFEAAMNAIRWFNEWKGPRPRLDAILEINAGWAGERKVFHVRARRVVEHFGLNPEDWLETVSR